jgi:hypothetical protein
MGVLLMGLWREIVGMAASVGVAVFFWLAGHRSGRHRQRGIAGAWICFFIWLTIGSGWSPKTGSDWYRSFSAIPLTAGGIVFLLRTGLRSPRKNDDP